MLETLKARKEALEAQGKKGFTLMEMLIVIAIIAILIAIAIPIFTAQLENARDSVSIANIRSAYAEAQTAYITKQDDGTRVDYTAGSGTNGPTVKVSGVKITTNQQNDWSGLAADLPWASTAKDAAGKVLPTDGGTDVDNATITFTYNTDGQITKVEYA